MKDIPIPWFPALLILRMTIWGALIVVHRDGSDAENAENLHVMPENRMLLAVGVAIPAIVHPRVLSISRAADINGEIYLLQDNRLKGGNDALKLNVPSAVMRKTVYRLNNEKTNKLAEAYEKLYERKNSPNREPPERDKPAVRKKPKL